MARVHRQIATMFILDGRNVNMQIIEETVCVQSNI